MQEPSSYNRPLGPWMVALGVALWSTESAFRIPLGHIFPDSAVIVFYEHLLLVLLLLPGVIAHCGELRQLSGASFGYILFSGIAGSAVGTVLYTEALRRGNPTLVNLVLNLQPVLTTPFAYWLFRDRFPLACFPWAALAVLCGMALSIEQPDSFGGSLRVASLDGGMGLGLLCALCWGFSTVAGRGVMLHIKSLLLAAGLRVLVGLAAMTIILWGRGLMSRSALWPAAAQAAPGQTLLLLIGLATLSGCLPLLLFFAGLRRTRASTAGYFEMLQNPVAVAVTWGLFGFHLLYYQVAAGVVMIASVVMLQRTQAKAYTAALSSPPIGGTAASAAAIPPSHSAI